MRKKMAMFEESASTKNKSRTLAHCIPWRENGEPLNYGHYKAVFYLFV